MAELQSVFTTGALEHRIVYGVDYSLTHQEGIRDGTVPPVGETFPTRAFPTSDYTLLGLFVEDQIKFGPVTFYPALRWDYYDLTPEQNDPLYPIATYGVPAGQSDSHVSPKISVVWEADELVTVFTNFALGFKAPSPSQVNNGFANLISNYRSIPNTNLKPETSETIEGGVRLHGDFWSASVTGFHGSYDDFITQEQVGGNFTALSPAIYQFVNLSDVKISGVEGRGRVSFGEGFALQLGVAWQEGSSTTRGVEMPLATIDPLKFISGLSYRDPDGRFGGEVMLTHSAKKNAADAGVTCTPACFIPPAFTILDVTAYWNATENVTLRGGLFNLFDEKYWWWGDVRGVASNSNVVDAYSQPGRNFSVSVAIKF
jgi:hemoglobin/transferrin/lactoferrin receptor protein